MGPVVGEAERRADPLALQARSAGPTYSLGLNDSNELGVLEVFAELRSTGELSEETRGTLDRLVELAARARISRWEYDIGQLSPDGFESDSCEASRDRIVLRGVMWVIHQTQMSCRASFEVSEDGSRITGYQICYGSAYLGLSNGGPAAKPAGYKKPNRWLVRVSPAEVELRPVRMK